MKKRALFLLIFLIFFLIIASKVVFASTCKPGQSCCGDTRSCMRYPSPGCASKNLINYKWYNPGGSVYRNRDVSYSGTTTDADGYRCTWEGQYRVGSTTTYCCGTGCCSESKTVYAQYVTYDGKKKSCDCIGGSWTAPDRTDFGNVLAGATGSHCCGDDGATETYEDPGSSRNCCYKGHMLLHRHAGDGITIPNDLFCYSGRFYSCNHHYGFASYNTGDCYQIGGYYCMPSPGNIWKQGTGEGVSCGDCRECTAGECKGLCVSCQYCIAGSICVWYGPGTDDPECGIGGVIDCSGWYSMTGRRGPDDDNVQRCWSYADIISAQCKTGGCKEANTADCETWSYLNDIPEYECGECQYIEDGDCSGTNRGSCTNYPTNTPCRVGGDYGLCNGAGTCNVITECADGTPVASCSADQPKYCDHYGSLYDDCGTCNCPAGLDCVASGSCINPDFDCSAILNEGECNNNVPTCFWDGTGCSSCAEVTSCASYTYSEGVCEADMCGFTGGLSSSCSWNDQQLSCYEYFFIEDCFNGVDDDGDWLADCNDPDCFSTAYCQGSLSCGDGVIDSGEECDKGFEEGQYIFPYGWDSCTDFGFEGGTLACNPPGSPGKCKFDFSDCTDPTSPTNCSNGIKDSGESCDGAELGTTCEDLGFFSGDLNCVNCHFDTWFCVGAVTQESNPEACVDGIDNDDDEYRDYEDVDCQSRDPTIIRTGGSCDGNKTATATLTYTYYLRFGLDDVIITKDVEITCPIPISAIVPFFSLLSFLIVAALLFVYYLLREKKFIKA